MPFKKDGDNKVLLWWPSISLHTWNFFHWSKTCRKNPQQKVPPKWFNSCPFYPLIGGHVLTIPKKSRFHHPQKMKNILNQGIRLYKIEKEVCLNHQVRWDFYGLWVFPETCFVSTPSTLNSWHTVDGCHFCCGRNRTTATSCRCTLPQALFWCAKALLAAELICAFRRIPHERNPGLLGLRKGVYYPLIYRDNNEALECHKDFDQLGGSSQSVSCLRIGLWDPFQMAELHGL